MRCAAFTLTANLKTEQALDVTSNPVIVRLDDSGASGFADELDEILAADCVHELVIHGFSFTIAALVSCCAFWGLGTTTGFSAVTGVTSAVFASHSSAVRSRAITCSGTEIPGNLEPAAKV